VSSHGGLGIPQLGRSAREVAGIGDDKESLHFLHIEGIHIEAVVYSAFVEVVQSKCSIRLKDSLPIDARPFIRIPSALFIAHSVRIDLSCS